MNFSQRRGLKPVRTIIQKDSIDEELRTALWNNLTIYYFSNLRSYASDSPKDLVLLLKRLWIHFFKYRLDEFQNDLYAFNGQYKNYFFNAPWNEVFDFIEFIIENYQGEPGTIKTKRNLEFIDQANLVLEQHMSAYRIVNFLVTEITSDEEINSIEKALEDTSSISTVKTHLRRSLELLTDRKTPDFRNSIKESISAVEALCIVITNDPKATLGQALTIIEKSNQLHPALKKSFSSLYGYTSDSGGIRHALIDEDNLTQDDARFMLVSCTSFINYLLTKFRAQ